MTCRYKYTEILAQFFDPEKSNIVGGTGINITSLFEQVQDQQKEIRQLKEGKISFIKVAPLIECRCFQNRRCTKNKGCFLQTIELCMYFILLDVTFPAITYSFSVRQTSSITVDDNAVVYDKIDLNIGGAYSVSTGLTRHLF